MSLWDSLVGTVKDVVGDIGGLFSGTPDLSSYMNDAALLVKDVGAPYPMTQTASMFSDLNLGGLGNFLNNYGSTLYPLAKAGITGYLGSQEAQDYMSSRQPLVDLSAKNYAELQRLSDPQLYNTMLAREKKRLLSDVEPFISRVGGQDRMLARRRGTPWGASTEGDYSQGMFNRYAMNEYNKVADAANVNVQNEMNRRMNMLTNQYNTLAGSPQYSPYYQTAASYNPWTSAFKSLLG